MKQKIIKAKFNFKKYRWLILIATILLPVIICLIYMLLGLTTNFMHNHLTFKDPWKWMISGAKMIKIWPVIAIILGFYLYWIYYLLGFKVPKEAMIKTTTKIDYGSAQWMTDTEFNQKYPQSIYNQPHQSYGVVVASQQDGINTNTNVCPDSHALVLGGSGSGKTQNLVIPTIQSNAYSTIKPSMVISDPKGELYNTQSQLLQSQGYDIKVLNLRDTSKSMKWNPLTLIYQNWITARNLMLEKIEYETTDILFTNNDLTCFHHQQRDCITCINLIQERFWVYQNHFHYDNSKLDQVINQNQLNLFAKMRNDLKDLCNALYPIVDIKQAFWPKNAAKLVKAVVLAMIEDLEEHINQAQVLTIEEEQALAINYLPLQKFNLTTVTYILAEFQDMKKWFETHPNGSAAKLAAHSVITSAHGQLSGITSSMATELEIFEEPSIQNITCENDFDLKTIDTKPTAIFIIIPDERTEHHIFVSLFVSQLYKALIEKANLNPNSKLLRPCYFILDEFGNIPTIVNMNSIITVARSRSIFFLLILQDMKQLEEKYGRETSHIIFTNCLLHIFLQTMNLEIARNYAEMIGKTTVLRVSTSGKEQTKSTSESLEAKDLILANELIQLPANEAIIFYSKSKPAKVDLVPWYQIKNQITGKIADKTNLKIYDFYQNYYYDFKKGVYFPKQITRTEIDNISNLHQELQTKQEQLKFYKNLNNLTATEEHAKTTLEFEIFQLTLQIQGGH